MHTALDSVFFLFLICPKEHFTDVCVVATQLCTQLQIGLLMAHTLKLYRDVIVMFAVLICSQDSFSFAYSADAF